MAGEGQTDIPLNIPSWAWGGTQERDDHTRLLPHWTSLPDPPKLLSSLELTWISAYTISYDKAISSLTTCLLTSHLIWLTLDFLVSFDASHGIDSMRDLVKNIWKKKSQHFRVTLSSIRVLPNDTNITITKWGSDWNRWRRLCEISSEQQEQVRPYFHKKSAYTGTLVL